MKNTERKGRRMNKLEVARTVLILNAQYKECDPEIMGTYDSIDALLTHFSEILRNDHKKEKPKDFAEIVAHRTADLLGDSTADGCWDGRTRYWYEEHEVFTLKKGENGDEI